VQFAAIVFVLIAFCSSISMSYCNFLSTFYSFTINTCLHFVELQENDESTQQPRRKRSRTESSPDDYMQRGQVVTLSSERISVALINNKTTHTPCCVRMSYKVKCVEDIMFNIVQNI